MSPLLACFISVYDHTLASREDADFMTAQLLISALPAITTGHLADSCGVALPLQLIIDGRFQHAHYIRNAQIPD